MTTVSSRCRAVPLASLLFLAVWSGCGSSNPKRDGGRDGNTPTDTRAPGAEVAAPAPDTRPADVAPSPDLPTDLPVVPPDAGGRDAADAAPPDTRPPLLVPPDAGPDAVEAQPDTTPPSDVADNDDTAAPPDGGEPDTGEGDDAEGDGGGEAAPIDPVCGMGIPLPAACSAYCSLLSANCTAANAQFASDQACLDMCTQPTWSCGAPGDRTGNSVFCRSSYAADAMTSPATSCPNAGPSSDSCR